MHNFPVYINQGSCGISTLCTLGKLWFCFSQPTKQPKKQANSQQINQQASKQASKTQTNQITKQAMKQPIKHQPTNQATNQVTNQTNPWSPFESFDLQPWIQNLCLVGPH